MIGGGWRRGGEERATDGESATAGHSKRSSGKSVLSEELYQGVYMAANSIQESILWIQAQEKKMVAIGCRGDSADHKNLLELKSGLSELLEKLLRLAESETQRKIRAQQNACWIGNKGKAEKRIRSMKSMDSQSKIAEDAEMEFVGKSSKRTSSQSRSVNKQSKICDGGKSIFNRFREQELQAMKELFEELPDNISMSIAASVKNIIEAQAETLMEERAAGFKLGLFSRRFDGLWDSMRQLTSTELKFLAISMFTCDESFVRCCSTLKSISAVIDRLGDWVPELTGVIRQTKKDEAILIRDVDVVMRQNKEDEDVLTRDGDVVMRQNKEDEDVLSRDEEEEEEEDLDVRTYEVEKKAEEYYFAAYRRYWERRHGNGCNFEDPTLFSPMQFTHYMPGNAGQTINDAKLLRTMQIYSIKVAETKGIPLEWPLNVYGVVAARDVVDHRRNHLFLRTRDDCQILTEENPFLHLTGPSRAIMSGDTVMIEVQLQLKGRVQSEDAVLIGKAFTYDDDDHDDHGDSHLQGLCTIVLSCEHLEQSVQATILSVCAVQGSLPWGNGIVCSALSLDKTEVGVTGSPKHVLLFDSQAGTMPEDEECYLELSRNVVSVKSTRELTIFMRAGELSGSVVFTPQSSNVSQGRCNLGNCLVEITVAWSLLVESQHLVKLRGSIEPYGNKLSTCMPFMKLVKDAC
ncbi:unnamed protein product [Triticum turgidum subsp. durum]|uniref:DUF6598 domain-containing protein n=1 Tax=Triticum turgidum subsp. durum TaxID=4567 RepID=A0A9R1PG90_TRITD|nr:unnamed protein product [Triticum turgidum subsp. durum]